MSTLTGRTVATTYKDLLQISNQNAGIDGDFRYIEDGEGTISVLGLSTDGIQINGNVTPSLDMVFDLGSSSKRFRDLWLSGNSIHIGATVFTSEDVQAVKDVQTTSVPVSTIAELASTSVQPGDPISFSTLINQPVTLEGYGITDGATQSALDQTNDILTPVQSAVVAGSANWNSTHNSVHGTSGNWSDTFTTVKNNSGDWFSPGLTTLLQQNSGTWNNATQPDTDVQFNDLTVTGHIAGPAVMTIDPAAVGNNTGRVVIAGDLQVDGVTTTVNSTTMTVSGKTITLAEGATDPSMTDQSGIHVDHVDANILYDSTTDTWRTNRDLVVQDKLTAATLSATGHVVVDGTVDAAGDLKVQGDSVVTQHDVGTAPNQIPQNKDLGSLAYQDTAHIEDLTIDTLELRGVAAEIQETARAVFVYDTSKDSDGGAWRKRTDHISWFNEPLNTNIRGSRREFPSVAVLVLTSNALIIYDGDDPDMPMWMVLQTRTHTPGVNWENLGYGLSVGNHVNINPSDVACVNGQIVISNESTALQAWVVNLLSDDIHIYSNYGPGTTMAFRYKQLGNISDRYRTDYDYIGFQLYHYTNDYGLKAMADIRCVAMHVPPGAPINTKTGLPKALIAFGAKVDANRRGGAIVQTDDIAVYVDNQSGNAFHHFNFVQFDSAGTVWFGRRFSEYPVRNFAMLVNCESDGTIINLYGSTFSNRTPSKIQLIDGRINGDVIADIPSIMGVSEHAKAVAQQTGLNIFSDDAHSGIAHVTDTYNTGHMYGDTRLALGGQREQAVLGSSINSSTELMTDVNNWSNVEGEQATWTFTSARSMEITQDVPSGGSARCLYSGLDANKRYKLEFEVTSYTGSTTSSVGVIQQDLTYPTNDYSSSLSIFNGTGAKSVVFTNCTSIGFILWHLRTATLSNISLTEVTELVSAGDFADDYINTSHSDVKGWDKTNSATLSMVGKALRIDGGGGAYPSAYYTIQVQEGKYYQVSADYEAGDFSARVRVSKSAPLAADVVNGAIMAARSTHKYTFRADETGDMYVALLQQDVNGTGYGQWDNVSVVETDERVQNGTFGADINHWTTPGGLNSNLSWNSNGYLEVERVGDYYNQGAAQRLKTTVGQTYVAEAEVVYATHRAEIKAINDVGTATSVQYTAIGQKLLSDVNGTTGKIRMTFTATADHTYIVLGGSSDSSAIVHYDNVSVKPVETDYSGHQGVYMNGQIIRESVATGSDMTCYTGFSDLNYFSQNNTPFLNFGADDDFSITGWFRGATGGDIIVCRLKDQPYPTEGTDAGFIINFGSSDGKLVFGVYTQGYHATGRTTIFTPDRQADSEDWKHFAASRVNGVMKLWVNGQLQAETPNTDDLTDDEATLWVGKGPTLAGDGDTFQGDLALLKIKATGLTQAQVNRMYADEVMLFQANAKSTLRQPHVNAISYDTKTHAIHTGHSHGRDTFKGLCRVSTTDQSVTTTIGSYNDLIVEQ